MLEKTRDDRIGEEIKYFELTFELTKRMFERQKADVTLDRVVEVAQTIYERAGMPSLKKWSVEDELRAW